jgi:uncharacterized membrane protein YgcG
MRPCCSCDLGLRGAIHKRQPEVLRFLNRRLPPAAIDDRSFESAGADGHLRLRSKHAAFTLFELILAIALSVVLLALIGAAINLYLLQVDASRTYTEEAQLARSILAVIADDLRGTSVYKAQDTSGIASLISASSEFDVDSIDAENPGSNSGGGSSFGTTSAFGTNSGGSSSGSGFSSSGSSEENDLTPALGINGTMEELLVDVERLPRLEQLFRTTTGYANVQSLGQQVGALGAMPERPSSVNTVRYFVREGPAVAAGSPAATSLAPNEQLAARGLVRQEISRPERDWALQAGDQAVLESNQTLLAPEVAHIEFRYFDPSLGQVLDYWDMQEKGTLPPSIEVRIWIWPADTDPATTNPNDVTSIMANCHEYRQIVFIPNSALGTLGASSGMSGENSGMSSDASTSSSATSGSTSFGSGSSFDQ